MTDTERRDDIRDALHTAPIGDVIRVVRWAVQAGRNGLTVLATAAAVERLELDSEVDLGSDPTRWADELAAHAGTVRSQLAAPAGRR